MLQAANMDKTKIAVSVFDKLADVYQGKFMDVYLYHDSLNNFCKQVPKANATILELACGPGNITKYLLSKRPDLDIFGIDLAPNMVALAKENNPNAKFEVMDCRAIATLRRKYDGIVCGFCLPYLSDIEAEKMIQDAGRLLNYSGILYLSTMEGYYNKSQWETGSSGDKVFMHYHHADELTRILKKEHFKIISLERLEYISNAKETIDLIIIAKKN